jgi:hypothetical protein
MVVSIMPSVMYGECCKLTIYAECRYVKCHYAECCKLIISAACRYVKCHYFEYCYLTIYAECRYVKCHYDECRVAVTEPSMQFKKIINKIVK